MLYTIPNILDADMLASVHDALGQLAWRDGRETAGAAASKVKNNEQADLSSRAGTRLRESLVKALRANGVFMAASQPRRMSRLLISRSGEGQGYGTHVDNALMGEGAAQIRTDLSFTLFLNSPEDYQGGELMIDWAGLSHTIKLPAGSLVLYPSGSLHKVDTVRSGTRTVCVGWIESLVRSSEQREVLFEIANLRANLSKKLPEDAPEHLSLSKINSNLRRLWAGS